MDKDLEQSVKKLERGVELKDEEAMHGERIAQTIELNEDLEEKYSTIKKLEKQLKTWRKISVIELVILIIVLLYACGAMLLKEPPDQEIQTEVMEEEVTALPVQNVSEETITFHQECPEIDFSQVESTTTDALISTLSSHENAPYDVINYLGEVYRLGEGCPSGVSVYSVESLARVFGNEKCVYSVNSGGCSEKDHNDGNSRVLSQPIYVCRFDEAGNPMNHNYYNVEYLEANFPEGVDNLFDHIAHYPFYIEISIYEDTDLDVETLIKGIIEDYPVYSDVIAESGRLTVSYTWDSQEVRDSIRDRIEEGLSGVDHTLTFGSSIYDTYDDVKENADGTIVCKRDGEEIIPETVKKYNIEVMNYGYYYLTCAYKNHWY